MSSESSFFSDPEFCPECGTILPLPGAESTITCCGCNFKVNRKNFDGITVSYKIKFNNKEKFLRARRERDRRRNGGQEPSAGPVVDRVCAACGHNQMTYTTLQTRSADEGQTVFYACPQCDHREYEHS